MAKQAGTPSPVGTPVDTQGSSQWVLTAIHGLTQSVGQIEGKLEGIIKKLDESAEKTNKVSEDLHSLNKKIAYAAGGVAVAVAVASFVIYGALNLAISFAKDVIHGQSQQPAAVTQQPAPTGLAAPGLAPVPIPQPATQHQAKQPPAK